MANQGGNNAQGAPVDPTASLDAIVHQITTASTNPTSLVQTLHSFAPPEVRELILAGLLPGPQDPLAVLDVRVNTLGYLFILSARLSAGPGAPPVDPAFVDQFCAGFDPEQARFAPDRVTYLAKCIVVWTEAYGKPTSAIHPLHSLLTRLPPDLSHLTPLHPIFVSTCLKHGHAPSALLRPILDTPISEVSTVLFPDLAYTDSLVYHYVGGIIYGQWKDWAKAEEFFEICVGNPANTPSAVQWDALKKLVLVQCISRGKTVPTPKYMNPGLARLLKNSVYSSFTKSYPRNTAQLRELAEKEKEAFSVDKNLGLVHQALERASRWNLKRLTDTYLTLGLAEIGAEIGVQDQDAVRALVVSMIEAGDIAASISADGTVSFFDAPVNVTKAQIDAVLREAQAQSARLVALEREISASKEFLSKAAKNKDDDRWPAAGDDEEALFSMARTGAMPSWMEEAMTV